MTQVTARRPSGSMPLFTEPAEGLALRALGGPPASGLAALPSRPEMRITLPTVAVGARLAAPAQRSRLTVARTDAEQLIAELTAMHAARDDEDAYLFPL